MNARERILRTFQGKKVDNSLAFLRKLRTQKLVDYMSWAFATPYPGSDLYRTVSKYNLTRPSPPGRQTMDLLNISMNLPCVSSKQMFISRAKGLMLQGIFASHGLCLSPPFYSLFLCIFQS